MPTLTPLQSIKKYCLDCSGDSIFEVKSCPAKTCPLYQYRSGKSGRTRNLSPEQRQALSERFKKSIKKES